MSKPVEAVLQSRTVAFIRALGRWNRHAGTVAGICLLAIWGMEVVGGAALLGAQYWLWLFPTIMVSSAGNGIRETKDRIEPKAWAWALIFCRASCIRR